MPSHKNDDRRLTEREALRRRVHGRDEQSAGRAVVRFTTRSAAALALVAALVAGRARGAFAAEDCVVIEDFADAPVGQFPPGWKVRKNAGKQAYTVQEEDGRKFLRAEAHDVGIQAAKDVHWDIHTHPILAWSWRPRRFPEGADERTDKNDSVLAVYAVFPHTPLSVKTLKYIWSETVPVDMHLTSSHGLTQVRALRSGRDGLNRWSEEQANVLEDYKRYFEKSDAPAPAGIAVLTDSDDAHSIAIGDYANFRLCRR